MLNISVPPTVKAALYKDAPEVLDCVEGLHQPDRSPRRDLLQRRPLRLRHRPGVRRREQAARPKERRFYTRWWVWTLASIGAVGIATAIIVPTVLSQRSSCHKLSGEVCFSIELPAGRF